MVKYIRGSETNDGKRLVKSNGQTVFNASPEEYYAEGWSDYTVMLESSKGYRNPVEEKEEPVKTELELKESLVAEVESYCDSIADKVYIDNDLVSLSSQDRVVLHESLKSSLEMGIKNIEYKGKVISIEQTLPIFKNLDFYWLTCRVVRANCIQEIRELKTQKEILEYDYIDKFPDIPSFSL